MRCKTDGVAFVSNSCSQNLHFSSFKDFVPKKAASKEAVSNEKSSKKTASNEAASDWGRFLTGVAY